MLEGTSDMECSLYTILGGAEKPMLQEREGVFLENCYPSGETQTVLTYQ